MPDIRTALRAALAVSEKTNIEKCWLWIKDHPRISSRSLDAVFKRPMAASIHEMKRRGMLKIEEEMDKRIHHSPFSVYSVTQKEYDLLPVLPQYRKTSAKAPAPAPAAPPAAPALQLVPPAPDKPPAAPAPVPAPTPAPQMIEVGADFDVDKLTLGQARALYAKLGAILK